MAEQPVYLHIESSPTNKNLLLGSSEKQYAVWFSTESTPSPGSRFHPDVTINEAWGRKDNKMPKERVSLAAPQLEEINTYGLDKKFTLNRNEMLDLESRNKHLLQENMKINPNNRPPM